MRSWHVVAGLGALAVVAQGYGVYRPTGPPSAPWFPNADKLEHAVGFGLPVALLLAALTLRARDRGRSLGRVAPVVVIAVFLAHAVLSEVIQHFFYRYRTGDPLDALADSVGIALGAGFSWVVRSRLRAGPDRQSRHRRRSQVRR
jgi:VanZ family protein